jgi:hypothetical protein
MERRAALLRSCCENKGAAVQARRALTLEQVGVDGHTVLLGHEHLRRLVNDCKWHSVTREFVRIRLGRAQTMPQFAARRARGLLGERLRGAAELDLSKVSDAKPWYSHLTTTKMPPKRKRAFLRPQKLQIACAISSVDRERRRADETLAPDGSSPCGASGASGCSISVESVETTETDGNELA